MKSYDTLIIGSGYTSLGMAISNENTLICEESESCDANFYLTLKSFVYDPYVPKTVHGANLLKSYSELGLFSQTAMNCNGFECAFCRFALQNNIKILLKCRVVNIAKNQGNQLQIILITNGGLETVSAKRIVDTRCKTDKKLFTVLFEVDGQTDLKEINTAFEDAQIEQAFYGNRNALHIKVDGNSDYNDVLEKVYNKWDAEQFKSRLLYVAPRFAPLPEGKGNVPCDAEYMNPIAAFEAGLNYAVNCFSRR